MVGGGVVAMPVAFKQSGLLGGIIFMVSIAAIFEYTGYQLGKVWCKMMQRYPHLGVCRKPFPEMAKRTMGPGMQRFTSVMGNVTLFGIAVVYLLLSANIIHYFIGRFTSVPASMCMVIVILAVVILPFTFLRSPGEFWGVVVIAMATTVIAVLSILIGIGIDSVACFPEVAYPEQTSGSIILSLGIFLFAFSGHYVFPTIQHDMKNPHEFTKSVAVGFFLVVLLYMPLSVMGYVVYGSSLESSVIYSIQTGYLQLGANLMIAVHCIMTLVIVINPLNQEVEHYLKISHSFGTGRVVTRTTVLLLVLFVGLSVPDFSPVMNLVGASTIPVGCAVLPSLFYLYSEAATEDEWRKGHTPTLMNVIRRTDKTKLIINVFMLIVAVIGGVLGTMQGLEKIAKAEFSAPCYVRAFTADNYSTSFKIIQHCCGRYMNISTYNEICGV
nr:Amino acid transporter domain containing protein [Haemonchus contortus]